MKNPDCSFVIKTHDFVRAYKQVQALSLRRPLTTVMPIIANSGLIIYFTIIAIIRFDRQEFHE